MKKILLSFILIFAIASGINSQNLINISGSGFDHFNNISIKVFNSDMIGYDIIETKSISKQGEFNFQIPFENINLYELNFDEKHSVYLSIENDNDIFISLEGKNTKISGSESSQKILDFEKQNGKLQAKYFGDLKARMDKAMNENNDEEIKKIQKEAEEAVSNFLIEFRALIVSLGETPAGYFVTQYSDFNKEIEFMEERLGAFNKTIPNSPVTKAFGKQIYMAKNTAIGKTPPNFRTSDMNGDIIDLKDFKNKIVLIDFWAYWCRECRVENPKLAHLYSKNKDKGFVILSISKAVPKNKWLDAIEKDHISDFINILDDDDRLSELYSVSSLPQNLLLDKSGKIIAKNINAEELEKILSKF